MTKTQDMPGEVSRIWRGRAWVVLVLVAVLAVLAGWRVSNIGFDYDFEQLFPTGHSETAFFREHREAFGHDNDFLLIALEARPGETIWEPGYWRILDELTGALEIAPHVRAVSSPTRVVLPVGDPALGGMFRRPLIRWESAAHFARDSAGLGMREGVLGSMVALDHGAAAILLEHDLGLSKAGCDELARDVRKALAACPLPSHISGRATSQLHIIEVLGEEILKFSVIGLLLIMGLLAWAFRSWWGVAVPMAVVLLGIFGTLAAMELGGHGIDLMTVVLPTILFVVGISDAVHISTRYLDEIGAGKKTFDALRTTFRDVGLATFTTSLTTAVGFLALWTSPIAPIRRFGMYSALGVLLAYLLAFSVLPSILLLVRPGEKASLKKMEAGRSGWRKLLDGWLRWSLKHRRAIPWAMAALTMLTAVGAAGLHANQKLLQDLRKNDPIQQDFRFFEAEFSGVRPFELAYILNDESWRRDPEVWAAMDSIEDFLSREIGIRGIQSLVVAMKNTNRLANQDRAAAYVLPTAHKGERMLRRMENRPAALGKFTRHNPEMARVSGRVEDIGSREMDQRIERLHAYAAQFSPKVKVRITGTSHLIDVANRELTRDMAKGLLIAFLAVALIAGLMFQSGLLVGVALWVNIIPLLSAAALMRTLGIDLNLSTSMLFTIAFGIAVDDTLHMLSHFRLMLRRGHGPAFAVRRTMHRAGKAIIITSLILVAGFMTLATSQLIGPAHIGWLVAWVLATAVIVDLTLLPLLLLWWARKVV